MVQEAAVICEKCGHNHEDRRATVTVFNVWMRLCPGCREKHGARDEKGEIIFYTEKKHGES